MTEGTDMPTVGPRPRQWTPSRRTASRHIERLLDGAHATFAQRGYRAARVQEICTRSKVGIGTFYAHFGHKRELLKRVLVERSVLVTTSVTPEILRDRGGLIAFLRKVNDDPVAAATLRAWYEAVLEEPEIARFHAEWRASTLRVLAATVAEAQRQTPSAGHRLDPLAVAWAIGTLSREMSIHDRQGAPDMETLAGLIEHLVFRPADGDAVADAV
jgi:AcrR family transcriptional regulator